MDDYSLELDQLIKALSDPKMQQNITRIVEGGETLREVKGLSDDAMEAIYHVAYYHYEKGNYDQAHAVFEFLCYFDYTEQKYWIGLGATRRELKKYDEAIEAFSVASLWNIDDPRPPFYCAQCHLALGNVEAAMSGLEFCVNAEGNDDTAIEFKKRAANLLEVLAHNVIKEK